MVKTPTQKLDDELSEVMRDFTSYHNEMASMVDFYRHSAYFAPKAGESRQKSSLRTNYLRVFADKNIHYTSPFPTIKVPTTGADPVQRQAASVREKILYATHRASNTPMLQALWAFDATVKSCAIAETRYDPKLKRVVVKRYDPKFTFWQRSNDAENRVLAFWAVFPITAKDCQDRYGKTPKKTSIDISQIDNDVLNRVDGSEWFLLAIKVTEKTRTVWCGDVMIEEQHNHQQGDVSFDICVPFFDGATDMRGGFYLSQLVPLQAEINETMKQRANIVRRLANPVIWGRGIINRQFDEVKRGLRTGGGGFVGLKQGGELGILQVSDTNMLDNHQNQLLQDMMRQAGFGAAAFGEAGGANTSGDALSMVFNPTQRLIDHQNIQWAAFYEAINAKILRLYDKFGKGGRKFQLAGFSPSGTILVDDDGKRSYQNGGFDVEFDSSAIDGNYTSLAIFRPATPRDELAYKRLLMEAVKQSVISRTTAYEDWGILSPEDELALLSQEQQDPALNPQGVANLMKGAQGFMNNNEEQPADVGTDNVNSQ